MNTLRALDDWKNGSKSRSVNLHHDDGFGASPGWELTLVGSKDYHDKTKVIQILGCPTRWASEMNIDNSYQFLVPSDKNNWASLEEVIKFGLQKAEELGL